MYSEDISISGLPRTHISNITENVRGTSLGYPADKYSVSGYSSLSTSTRVTPLVYYSRTKRWAKGVSEPEIVPLASMIHKILIVPTEFAAEFQLVWRVTKEKEFT